MFVTSNKLSDLKTYFKTQLSSLFSESEIKLMFESLICKRLELSKTDLLLNKDILVSESDLLYVRNALKRLVSSEPFQYIIGETEFCGLNLFCDERALIPRPETEELLCWIQESLKNIKTDIRILDLCTGSGCIALALKNCFPKANVNALDVSKKALSLAEKNATSNNLQIDFFEIDLLAKPKMNFPKNSFDCWVSNPPYIPSKDKKQMNENVLNFEPHIALFVEDDNPLIFYRIIATLAKIYLKENGLLFFEIHENLAEEVKELLHELQYFNIEIKKDLQGKNRMIKAMV